MTSRVRRSAWRRLALAGLLLCGPATQAFAARVQDVPGDLQVLTLNSGKRTLEELWSRRPLLVTLYYTRCPGVCSPYLLALAESLELLGGAGRDYDVLALSFDPLDGPEQVRDHADGFGLLDRPGWIVATADPEQVARLADTFGFWYHLDSELGQYDHPAMTAVLSGGRILRVLEGNPASLRSLRESLWELQGHFVPSYAEPGKQSLFSCLAYDPVTGRTRPNWGLLLLILPALAAFGSVGLLFMRERTLAPRQQA